MTSMRRLRAVALLLVLATGQARAGEGAEAMTPYGAEPIRPAFLKALKMPPGGRIVYVRPSAQMPSEELLRLLRHWSPAVRVQAAQALAEQKRAEVLPLVRPLLEARAWHVRRAALDALLGTMALWRHSRGFFLGRSREERKASESAYGSFCRQLRADVAKLTRLLKDEHFWVRCGAAEVLGRMGAEAQSAAPQLLAAMGDADPWVAESATKALSAVGVGALEPSEALPRLRRALKHYRSRTRKAALAMLDQFDKETVRRIAPDLVDSTRNPAYDRMWASGPRLAAIKLLVKLGEKDAAVALCCEMIREKAWGKAWRRIQCSKILKGLGKEAHGAIPALREALQEEQRLRRADVVNALRQALEALTARKQQGER